MINPTHVDVILRDVAILLKNSKYFAGQNWKLFFELEYLRIYAWCLAGWKDSPFGRDKNFGFVEEYDIEATLEVAVRIIQEHEFQGFDAVAAELLEKIQQCKPKMKEDCLHFLDCPFQCEFSIDELLEFMMSISTSLGCLLHLKADIILDVKAQVKSLDYNLHLLKEVFEFTSKWCSSHEDLKVFKIHTQAWACCAACLSIVYWVQDVKQENMAPRMDVVLSDLHKKINPSTPEVTRMYLAVLKASNPSAEDNLMVSKLVPKFVEFLKDNLQVDPEEDGFQMLFIELIFLITFLMDRPETEKLAEGKLVFTRADAAVNEVALLVGKIKEGISEQRNFLIHNFLEKAKAIKEKVRKIYPHLFLDPSSFNFPRINVLGSIDSLLVDNLKELCSHFPKYLITMLQEELLSLKESNSKVFSTVELQNKNKDFEDIWTRIAKVAHIAERAVCSIIYMQNSLWHDILCLSDVFEEIKLVKGEMRKIQEQHMNDIHAPNSEMSYNPLPLQASIPTVDKIVGFKDEVKEIIGRLMGGSTELDIISIVGMAGMGKTTLAKKIFCDASIRSYFHKCAWCTVSQTLDSNRMLSDILSDVDGCNVIVTKWNKEDLAETVYRKLRGHRYLIVMDDIWDVSAWNALKLSFPEDNKGSRIIFTSRIHKVVAEAKSGCSPLPLNPLSVEESLELLERKLFDQDSFPPDFVEIGKQIARNCKRLPLAIVLTAGLLKEKIESLYWWKEVGENLEKFIAKEGCTDLLQLSYKHLPEVLKPCFLYLGSFAEDFEIRVKKLTQLWISEGFIEKRDIKSLEVVAEEHLMDLVSRSLVIVTKRGSTGGIKACGVHDLLRDFCIAKGEEERFLKVIRRSQVSHMTGTNAPQGVRIQPERWRSFLDLVPPASPVRSLVSLSLSSPRFEWIYDRCLTLSYLKLLRVLHLDANLYFLEFPEGITELILLRFLAINCYRSIPPSIMRLENLETLYVDSCLPFTIWEMQKLKHVYASSIRIPPEICDGIPSLGNVRSLGLLSLFYGVESEMFLRKMPNVRKLRCELRVLNPLMYCNLVVKLDFLRHLESLYLRHDSLLFDCDSCIPFHFPQTLKKLALTNFRLPWRGISVIAKLPNLEVLKLGSYAFCGNTWKVGDEEFLKLKFLGLRSLDIEKLDASGESFPCLERLQVVSCYKLEEIPSRFGSISTLTMIQVEYCHSAIGSSVRKVQEEQHELGNERLEVLISGPHT